MKASFRRPPPKLLNRSTARNAVLLNLCATPGLGSLMAGRRVAGLGQLVLAVVGFALVVGWFVLFAIQTYNRLVNDATPQSVAGLGAAGGVAFGAAWVWALVTSLSILRQARRNEPPLLA